MEGEVLKTESSEVTNQEEELYYVLSIDDVLKDKAVTIETDEGFKVKFAILEDGTIGFKVEL